MVHVLQIGVLLVGGLAAIAQTQRSTICDDASTVADTCSSGGYNCSQNEVYALQNGCYLCVDSTTCLGLEPLEEHEGTAPDARHAAVDNGVQVDNPIQEENESTTTPPEESVLTNEDGVSTEGEGIHDTIQSESTESTSPETESKPEGTEPEEGTSQVDNTTVQVDAESQPEGEYEPVAGSPIDPEGQMEGMTEPDGETQEQVNPEIQQEVDSEGSTKGVDNKSIPENGLPNILLIPDHEQASLSVDQFRMRAEPQAADSAPMQSLKDVSNWYFAIPAFLAMFSAGIALRARFSDRSRDFERLPDDDEEEINPFCDGQQECDLEFAGQGDSDESTEHEINTPIPPSPVMSAH